MPENLPKPETSLISRIKRYGTSLSFTVLLISCTDRDTTPENLHSDKNLQKELADRKYSVYAAPVHTRPTAVNEFDKLNNPITPVCVEESATLAVDSLLIRAYVKGLGRPIVGYVADYEFPDILAVSFTTGLPDCTDNDRQTINVK